MAGTAVGAGLDRSRTSAKSFAASASPSASVCATRSSTGRSADQMSANDFRVVSSALPTPCNQVSAWLRASSGLGARRLPKETSSFVGLFSASAQAAFPTRRGTAKTRGKSETRRLTCFPPCKDVGDSTYPLLALRQLFPLLLHGRVWAAHPGIACHKRICTGAVIISSVKRSIKGWFSYRSPEGGGPRIGVLSRF